VLAVVVAEGWWAWVLVISTDTANGAIVLSIFFCAIRHLSLDCYYFRSFVIFFVASSAFSTCLNSIVWEGGDGVVWRF
jgi:hypothetical protein